MHRHPTHVVTTLALLVFGLLLPQGRALAQQKTLQEQLVGAWNLVSYVTDLPDGTKQQILGTTPKGILILDASGRYAVINGRPDRPKFKDTTNLRSAATAEEWAAAARDFAANLGTWSVDEADKMLIRKFELALVPNSDTQETKAAVTLAGDDLTLTVVPAAGGKNVIVYRRAK